MNAKIKSTLAELSEAIAADKHPWRWPGLTTVSPEGEPHSRIVVLRELKGEAAFVYTDARTQKILDLRHKPACSLLFFDPDEKRQVRAGAVAITHHRDRACRERWEALNERQRGEYQAQGAPGQPHSPQGTTIDPSLGMAHFAVLELTLNRLDILKLTREAHIRHLFTKSGKQWTGGRIIA